MKREKSEKLLRLMGSVDEELLAQALEEKKTVVRRRFRFSYAAAACAAVVLLAGAAFAGGLFGKSPVEAVTAANGESTTVAALAKVTDAAESSFTDTSAQTTVPAAGNETDSEIVFAVTSTAVPSENETVSAATAEPRVYQPYVDGEGNQPCQGTGSAAEPRETRRLVEGEAGKTTVFAKKPANGEILFSDELEKALKEYGDTDALFRVNLEIFKSGTSLEPMDGSALNPAVLAETKRLENLGYITVYETYSDGKTTTCRLSLHATAEQLREFPASEDCGFRLSLWQEIAW